MSVTTTPHVNFRGQARQALDFYQSVFGGTISIATYTDTHMVEDPRQADQVAFGRLDAPNGFSLMAYDVQPSKPYKPRPEPFLHHAPRHRRRRDPAVGHGLAQDADTVLTPLAPAPFAPLYGMLTDRYGVTWIVGADPPATKTPATT